MSAKIVYVVYGSRSEISQLIAFLVSGEMCFHYSFSYDPTELIKEAGMDLKVDIEHWSMLCFNFKDAPNND